jgi:glucose/arabinose dehydrogenase
VERSTSSTRASAIIAGLLACVAAALATGGTAVASAPGRAASAVHLPAGFTDAVVAPVPNAVALAETPDARLLVADRSGKVWVIKSGALLATPALDISSKVCSGNSERGLLGIAVDPKFLANGFVYVYYTFRNNTSCGTLSDQVPVNRVVRFTMTGDTLDPASETILLDQIISYHANHEGGDVGFGHDGMLYVSVGDGACDYTGMSGCDPDNTLSRRGNTLHGKVLRITPTGGIPKGNPFRGSGTARCNHGDIPLGMTCRETYLRGFRNPFRFAFDPNSTRTRLFVNDVGEVTWEEIDKAVKGADYGWNVREGHCAQGSTTDCGAPPQGLTNPIFDYSHVATGCAAITGGAFVPDGLWGPGYHAGYLYADYICDKIFLLRPSGSGGWTSSSFARGLAPGGPVALFFGTHGATTALYYTTLANGGEVHVIDKA